MKYLTVFVGFALISAIIHQSTRACVFHHRFLKYWKTLDNIFFFCVSFTSNSYHLKPNHVYEPQRKPLANVSLCTCVTESEHFSHVLPHVSEAVYHLALDLTSAGLWFGFFRAGSAPTIQNLTST